MFQTKSPPLDQDLWAACQKIAQQRPARVPAFLGTIRDVDIYAVDGAKIKPMPRVRKSNRGYHEPDHMDFGEAGNTVEDPGLYDAVWGRPKPKGAREQAYVDVKNHPSEWAADIMHELTEMPLMQRGQSYGRAHPQANVAEKAARLTQVPARA